MTQIHKLPEFSNIHLEIVAYFVCQKYHMQFVHGVMMFSDYTLLYKFYT